MENNDKPITVAKLPIGAEIVYKGQDYTVLSDPTDIGSDRHLKVGVSNVYGNTTDLYIDYASRVGGPYLNNVYVVETVSWDGWDSD